MSEVEAFTSSHLLLQRLRQYQKHVGWAAEACHLLETLLNAESSTGRRALARLLSVDWLWHIMCGRSDPPDYLSRIQHANLTGQNVATLQGIFEEYGLCTAAVADICVDDQLSNQLEKLASATTDAVHHDNHNATHQSLTVCLSLIQSILSHHDVIKHSTSLECGVAEPSAIFDENFDKLIAKVIDTVFGVDRPSSVLLRFLAAQFLTQSLPDGRRRSSGLEFIACRSCMYQQREILDSYSIHARTRTWLIGRVKRWLESPSERQFFVISGGPGTGKTAISATVCKLLLRKQVSARYFFTGHSSSTDDPSGGSGGGEETTDMNGALFTLSHCIATTDPVYLSFIDDNVDKLRTLSLKQNESSLSSSSWQHVYETLIVAPLVTLYGSMGRSNQVIIVLDGVERVERSELNGMLDRFKRDLSPTVRLLITCSDKDRSTIDLRRPRDDIEHVSLEERGGCVNAHIKDIEVYLSDEVSGMLTEQSARVKVDDVTLQTAIDELVKSSAGRFDWAVELARSFRSAMVDTSGQFLTSLKRAKYHLERTHGTSYQHTLSVFQSLFRAYRDQEGRSVKVNIM